VTVIDAGAVIKLLVGDIDLATLGPRLSAPHLIDSEVLHTLRRLVHSGQFSPAHGEVAFDSFRRLIVRRWPATPFLGRVWELRHNLSGYDATYVALAEALGVSLITTDRRLSRAPGLRCTVEVV
jgi:predicted nucleic acid-binding protein